MSSSEVIAALSDSSLWATVAEADTYFTTRYQGDGIKWGDQTTADKTAALTTAMYQVINSPVFELQASVTSNMQKAQMEQALFLIQQGGDVDRRMALQGQGVVKAGVVQETYKDSMTGPRITGGRRVPISPVAQDYLNSYRTGQPGIRAVGLSRDESEGIGT